ncbi:hypothetical protein KAR91_23020 [Candidatus Pacearchaeota archaeon]|nr:hypothetical protein [Candidatus Pacearchaeota archaeon]
MLKKTIKYVNFDGKEDQETLYFNLTEPEVVRLDVQFVGGLEKFIKNLDPEVRPEDVLNLFEKLIKAAYGEKSDDGRHFTKDPETANLFFQSAAYSALFVELIQDADKAAAFFNGLLSSTSPAKPVMNTAPKLN